MTEQTDIIEMSEAERIEVRRRIDVAFAVISAAAVLFSERAAIEKDIERHSKESFHHWCFGVLIVFVAIHYFILDGGQSYSWALAIGIFAGGISFLWQIIVGVLKWQRSRLNERLLDLQVTWLGVASGRFGNISEFRGSFYMSSDCISRDSNPAFSKWWSEQVESIRQNVRDSRQ